MSSNWQQNEIVIVGAGLAGLFVALKLSPAPVTIVTSAPLGKGASSSWAQGGIAAAIEKGDTAFAHAMDTIAAGAGIVNAHIAHILTSQAALRVQDLLSYGTPFDRNLEGDLLLSREAAHSARRVVRVKGDKAGWAIMKALISAVRTKPNIQVIEGYTAKKLATKKNAITGVHCWAGKGQHLFLRSRNVVLAAGGVGALYKITTNPEQANGEALAMAAKAGAILADTEFVQFHPTAINANADPAPLATEALRGDGATLINKNGTRFMAPLHDDGELAPRDIVARAVFHENREGRGAFLDCREVIGADFQELFPSVYKKCHDAGIDPITQPIPVAPAAHFHMGGIHTDAYGRTTLNGLWACGEVASTGAHGANRLASNSLLEAVVFAGRVAEDLGKNSLFSTSSKQNKKMKIEIEETIETVILSTHRKDIKEMRELMDRYVGIERNAKGLRNALERLTQMADKHQDHLTLSNMLTTARIITISAFMRKESRGGHYRTDYDQTDIKWAHRSFISLEQAEQTACNILNSDKGQAQ
ncbi:MAG: L-aspartate oxidase [bacterium]|nr:L-aspartate oxidase [bacterium]